MKLKLKLLAHLFLWFQAVNRPFYRRRLSVLAFSGSEAAVDLVMIQTLELFRCKFNLLAWKKHYSHIKRWKVCIKARSPAASLPIKSKVPKHTTVKWTIVCLNKFDSTILRKILIQLQFLRKSNLAFTYEIVFL